MIATIVYEGIELSIGGKYTAGKRQTYEDEGYASEFEIESIFVSDSFVDIFNLFDSFSLAEISELVIQNIEE